MKSWNMVMGLSGGATCVAVRTCGAVSGDGSAHLRPRPTAGYGVLLTRRASLQRRLVGTAEALDRTVHDLVDEDLVRLRLAVLLELDRLRHAVEGERLQELVDLLAGRVAGLDRLDEGRRAVVPLGGVDGRVVARRGLELVLEVLQRTLDGPERDVARAADDRALCRLRAGAGDELGVERAVTAGEGSRHASVTQLLDQPARLRVVAAVEDDVGGRGLHLGHRRGVVRRGRGELVALGGDALGLELLVDGVGETDAVLLVVADHEGLLRALRLDQGVGDTRPLVVVVRHDAVPEGPAVLRQTGVGGRRRDARDLALLQDRPYGLRLTGERRADETDDLVGADRLLHQRRRLVRLALAVVLDELDLHLRVLVVVLLDRELGPVARRDDDR